MDDYHQLIANAVTIHAGKLGRLIDYIEVGVLTGNSALAVLSTGKVRYAALIDNFSNSYCGETKSSRVLVEKRLKDYEGLFAILVGDSRNLLPVISDTFDIGFVDGDHSHAGCWSDMTNMLPLLREGGIMFVDDLDPDAFDLKSDAERFAFEHQLNFRYHKVHQGLGELRR